MDMSAVVALLISERDKLTRAIEALGGQTKRRGRPPKKSTFDYSAPNVPDWVKPKAALAPARKKRTFTAAQREAFGERMRKYWAKRRKAAAKGATA